MSTFTHADTCRCGGCQPAPPDGAYPEGPPGAPPACERCGAELVDRAHGPYCPVYAALGTCPAPGRSQCDACQRRAPELWLRDDLALCGGCVLDSLAGEGIIARRVAL